MPTTSTYRDIRQSSKLLNVRYDVRGPILEEAQRLEAAGQRIMRLNIGNPAPFGFEAPSEILKDMIANLPEAQGYSDSKGITPARRAVSQYYETAGIMDIRSDDVFIGNGVSEMISMVLQALLDDGDEVLIPAPDYPLWTGATTLSGGNAVHYRCVEEEGWVPDLEHIEASVSERTKAIVIINPNNPTGAVYSRETLEGIFDIARRYGLVVLSDEIYEKILYEDAEHIHAASIADDVLVMTFSGLSKAYRVAGYRAGWVAVSCQTPRDRLFRRLDPAGQYACVPMCQPSTSSRLPWVGISRSTTSSCRVVVCWNSATWQPGCSAKFREFLYSKPRARCICSRNLILRFIRFTMTKALSSSCCVNNASWFLTGAPSTTRIPTTSDW